MQYASAPAGVPSWTHMALEQPREIRGQRERNLPVTVTSGGNVQGEGSDYAVCGEAEKKRGLAH